MPNSAPRVLSSLLALGLALGATACKREVAAPVVTGAGDAAPVRVTAAVAVSREVPLTLALTGTLVPNQQSAVTPLVGGRVEAVMVERGAVVHAGDELMRLRDVDYRSNAATASASLEQAQARLGLSGGRFDPDHTPEVSAARANRDLADDALRRVQQLAQSGAVSDQDLQRATQQAAAAREQYTAAVNGVRAAFYGYQSARVAVDTTRRNVNDSTVRAPFDGEIAERSANVGEYVTAQRAVVTLVATNPLRIELQIPQERIPYVRPQQQVDLRIDAFPNRVFHGTLRYISASVRADTRSLIAEAIVPNDDHLLRPGLFVSARLHLDRTETMASVPPSAVLTEAGTSRAFVIVNGRVEERVVTVSERSETEVLISSGLAASERVATSALDHLGDGSRVTE
ncbi:MAG: efflux RND transporter periplasmic adaptor subunit [Deltaproteobacteria bacterium]